MHKPCVFDCDAYMHRRAGQHCRVCGEPWPCAEPPEVEAPPADDLAGPCAPPISAPAPARKPAAGWVDKGCGGWRLKAGPLLATFHRMSDYSRVFITSNYGNVGDAFNVDDDGIDAAKLAAEDALRSIATEILRAVRQ